MGASVARGREKSPLPAWEATEVIVVSEQLIREGLHRDAIELLQDAVPRLASVALKRRARLLLARSYQANPGTAKRAEETLQDLLRDEPDAIDAHFQLGRLYKAQNLHQRATAVFRHVLELDPEHKGALAELGGGRTGLLAKLFGRNP